MAAPTALVIAADGCRCGACGRPYPAAAGRYPPSVLALLTPVELAALDAFAARARDNGLSRPADAAEGAVVARVAALIGPRSHAGRCR